MKNALRKLGASLVVALLPAFLQAAVICWYVPENPAGQTVNEVTLGAVVAVDIICYDGGQLTTENIASGTVIASSSASYQVDDMGKDNIVTSTGASAFSSELFTEGKTYYIVVRDSSGGFFASNPLTAYSANGWTDLPSGVTNPSYSEWEPGKNAIDKWYSSGYVAIPEPCVGALVFAGAALLLLRRRGA